ncbi:MFS transporter [Candidatus Dependentiae bacterium]
MKTPQKISLNIVLLGIVSFLNDLSSEMITPILPFFIASLGGAGIATGLIGGIRDSITSLLKVVSGYISDKTGKRKRLVFSGYFLSSGFKMLLALSKTWQHALAFIGLERIGKGLRDAPRDTIIAQSMPKERGRAFGFHRTLDATGAVLGSIAAFILFHFLGLDFKTIILISAAVAFTSLIPIYFVKEKKQKRNHITLKATFSGLPSNLRKFLFISGIFSLSNFSYMFFILRAKDLFADGYTLAAPILLYVLYNIFYAGSSAPFGKLSDRIGRKKVLLLGYGLFAATTLGFALLHSIAFYVILFATYGVVNGIVDGNQRAFVADLSQEQARGTSLGTYHMIKGLLALPASFIAGVLWKMEPSFTFFYGAVLSLLAAVSFVIMMRKHK